MKPATLIMLTLSGLLCLAAEARAQGPVYPRQYLEQALENHPGLRAQFLSYEAAARQPDVAAALPDPEFTAGIYTPPMERLMGNQVFDAGLMQMFPWFGTLGRQRSMAEQMAEAELGQYLEERNMLFQQVTHQWLELYQDSQQLEILSRFIQILEEREDLIYTRYQAGFQVDGMSLDIYRLEMQINELENRRSRLQEDFRASGRSFNILLNRSPEVAVELADTLTGIEFLADAWPDDEALQEHPQLVRSRAMAQAAATEEELARLMTRPMMGLGLQYSHFAPGNEAMGQMDGGGMIMPMISVTIPIYGRRNQALRAQAAVRAQASEFMQQNQRNSLFAQYADLAARVNNLARDLDFLNRQLEINQMAWELVITTYAGGQLGFDQLLQIQDQLLELEWRRLETIVQQHQALVEMDRLMGREVFGSMRQ